MESNDLPELIDISGGDHQRAQFLRESLELLSGGKAGPELQELAKDVLAGRIGLRSSIGVSFYRDIFLERVQEFTHWRDSVDPMELDNLVREVQSQLDGPIEE